MAFQSGLDPKTKITLGYSFTAICAVASLSPIVYRSRDLAPTIAGITIVVFIIGLLILITKPAVFSRPLLGIITVTFIAGTILNFSGATVGQAHRYLELEHATTTVTAAITSLDHITIFQGKSPQIAGLNVVYTFTVGTSSYSGRGTISSAADAAAYLQLDTGANTISVRYVATDPSINTPETLVR